MAAKEEEETRRVDCWSELPYHLLDLIMDCLTNSVSDYISFGTVCASWRSAYNLHNPCLPSCTIPLLMVPPSFSTLFNPSGNNNYIKKKNKNKKKKYKEMKKKELDLRRFYNISDERVDDRLEVRMHQNRQCRGSSHGWLITVEDDNKCFSIQLFNPFTSLGGGGNEIADDSANIILPSLKELPFESLPTLLGYADLCKAVLSADPISNPTDYMVMAIYSASRELAFHRPGDKSWTGIKSPKIEGSKDGHFSDLIYYQGKFFAIHCWGIVVVCDDVAEDGMVARVLLRSPMTEPTTKKYLVESSQGDLLQVHRSIIMFDDKIYSTIGFTVFKLFLNHSTTDKVHEIVAEKDYEWVEMENLCGDSIFLGQNGSISISTIDYPGCKSNRIYYTDDWDFCIYDPEYGQHDMGVFNLEDGSFKRYFPANSKKGTSSVLISPNPIWVQPSLHKKGSWSF